MINVSKLFKISFLFSLFLTGSSHVYAMDDEENFAKAIAAQTEREEELTRQFKPVINSTSQAREESDPNLELALWLSQ